MCTVPLITARQVSMLWCRCYGVNACIVSWTWHGPGTIQLHTVLLQASQCSACCYQHYHGGCRFSKPSPPSQHQKSSSDTAVPMPVSALSRAFSSPAPLLAHQKSRSSVRSVSHRLSEQLSAAEVCHLFTCPHQDLPYRILSFGPLSALQHGNMFCIHHNLW